VHQQQQQQHWKAITGGRPESNFFHIHPRKVTEVNFLHILTYKHRNLRSRRNSDGGELSSHLYSYVQA
jgi:hypothetical protein